MSKTKLISGRLPMLLHRLVSVLVAGSTESFREFGLSIPAARVLVCIFESGDQIPVGTVSELTSIDLSTTSHILRRLEKLHFLIRERQADDNRVVMTRLTQRGREVAHICREASLQHESVLLKGMSDEDVALLKRLLVKAYENAVDGL